MDYTAVGMAIQRFEQHLGKDKALRKATDSLSNDRG
jgi:hypothetical protein